MLESGNSRDAALAARGEAELSVLRTLLAVRIQRNGHQLSIHGQLMAAGLHLGAKILGEIAGILRISTQIYCTNVNTISTISELKTHPQREHQQPITTHSLASLHTHALPVGGRIHDRHPRIAHLPLGRILGDDNTIAHRLR